MPAKSAGGICKKREGDSLGTVLNVLLQWEHLEALCQDKQETLVEMVL